MNINASKEHDHHNITLNFFLQYLLNKETFLQTSNQTFCIIFSSEPDCPSLQDADSLSQTQLIKRLTHGCRYDRLERPISKYFEDIHFFFIFILLTNELTHSIWTERSPTTNSRVRASLYIFHAKFGSSRPCKFQFKQHI